MAQGTCSVEGCERRVDIPSRGWCRMHYGRWHRGVPLILPAKPAACSIEGCERGGRLFRGWCIVHYTRWRRHGDPLINLKPRKTADEVLAILESGAFSQTDDCITMDSGSNVRPLVRFRGITMTASRAAWILANGDPGDLMVLHRCNGGSGTNGCINIRHLYLGDAFQNAQDKMAAGPAPKGWRNLRPPEVLEIRNELAEGASRMSIARRHGVTLSTISDIANGKTWKHV